MGKLSKEEAILMLFNAMKEKEGMMKKDPEKHENGYRKAKIRYFRACIKTGFDVMMNKKEPEVVFLRGQKRGAYTSQIIMLERKVIIPVIRNISHHHILSRARKKPLHIGKVKKLIKKNRPR